MTAVLTLFGESESWSVLTRTYFYMGLGASAVLTIQMALMAVGFGDADSDVDFEDPSDGLAIFSSRTLTAFSCLFGWTGFALERGGHGSLPAIISASIMGSLALFGVAYLMKTFNSMSQSGNIDRSQAMGKNGDVYLVIPKSMSGVGLVNVKIDDAIVEFDAMTEHDQDIPTGAKVLILECRPDNSLIVKPIHR
jgi:hypothetical protein